MIVPRGNVLLKPTPLTAEDFKIKLSNLQQHGFNGYIKAERTGSSFYAFMLEGLVRSVVELSAKTLSLSSELILVRSLSKAPWTVASYVLAPELVNVLSGIYAFQEKYLNYQVRKKEIRKVLGALDSERTTGIIEVSGTSGDDSTYLVLNQGRIVTDNFLDVYGQIVTGPEKVTEVIDYLSSQGGVLNTFGEKLDEIERKKKITEEELGRYKELVVSVESGGLRLGGSNVVRVDDGLLKEWSRNGTVQKIEIFVGEDHPESFKVNGKKGLGNKLVILPAVQKKLGVAKEESVLVRPSY